MQSRLSPAHVVQPWAQASLCPPQLRPMATRQQHSSSSSSSGGRGLCRALPLRPGRVQRGLQPPPPQLHRQQSLRHAVGYGAAASKGSSSSSSSRMAAAAGSSLCSSRPVLSSSSSACTRLGRGLVARPGATPEQQQQQGQQGQLAAAVPASQQQPQQQQHLRYGGGRSSSSVSVGGGPARQRLSPVAATFASAGGGDEGLFDKSPQFLEGLSGWRRRWTIVLLCFVAFMLCNMDRVNMSIAILPMSQQYGWNSQTVGLVQSSFFWGYLLTQVLGGVWADRFGGKLVLGCGVIWWSLATAATPLAAQAGLPTLLAARALMGVGEGVAMPAMNNLLSRWVPVAERSRSLSLVYSGMFIGSIVGLALSPAMIAAAGWPVVFYGFGSLGLAWYAAWNSRAASTPAEDPAISREEKAYIAANTSVSAKTTQSIPWGKLLSRREVWAIIVCHFCHNWGTFILLTWMPTYYNQVLGCDIFKSGIFSVLPWVTMAISANVGGWIADGLVAKGHSVTFVRKLMQTIGFLGPALCLSQLQHVSSLPAAVACMMGAQGFDAFSQSGLYSNHQDIGPRYAGVLLGLSNTAGVLAGVLGSLATGHILAHGSWSDVWAVAVGLYLVGTLVWNLFATGERIFD